MPNTAKTIGKNDWELSPDEWQKATEFSPVLKKLLPPIETEAEYDRAVERLDQLIVETKGKEDHALSPVLFALGILIEAYDEKQRPMENVTPPEVIQFLMEQHQLKQDELPEIGSQARVSEILSGKRQLNTRQIKKLTDRFGISAELLIA